MSEREGYGERDLWCLVSRMDGGSLMGNTVGGKQSRKGALFAYWLGLTLPVLINEE